MHSEMNRRRNIETIKEGKPKGHYMGIGMAIGMGIGIPIGLLIGIYMDNISAGIAMGPGIGAGIGVGLGAYLEKKRNPNPIEEANKGAKNKALLLTIAGLVILLVLGVVYTLLKHH